MLNMQSIISRQNKLREDALATSNFIVFGNEPLSFFEQREWLVTNGTGSYASGTVAGVLSRRYHGLLVAALSPPLGRTLLGVKLDETALYNSKEFSLFSNRWDNGKVTPEGYQYIESFALEGTVPVWTFGFSDVKIEKRIWMEPKLNTTYVQYQVLRSSLPLQFNVKAMVNYRGYHNTTHAGNWHFGIEPISNGCKVNAYPGAIPFYILSNRAQAKVENQWYYGYVLSKEEERGLDSKEDHLHACSFDVTLGEKESVTFVFTTEANADLQGSAALKKSQQHQNVQPAWIAQLMLAADAFIVDRPPDGKTVIAGYHWFGDWGRDTMISLPGLTLATGRENVAKSILETFAKYVDQGMLPNRFPDSNQAPEYNTVDASLWYFEAIRAYYESTKDQSLIEELFPVLTEMIHWHQKGTRYQIHVDPKDGLLYAGEKGVQLTWMDAKIGDWVVTPRIGKPIEINALWFNALKTMGNFARLLKKDPLAFDEAADKVKVGFQRFWNQEKGFCYDVIDGPEGNDPTLRPNQIFAVSLQESPLSKEQQKAIVEVCGLSLLTSRGLRSLAPTDAKYKGEYKGSPTQRDSVYHQGTVWGWLLGPYCLAHYKVFGDAKAALEILGSMSFHLSEAGLGTCSEIFDGDPPFTPRGCIAQAWTVAEILRAWKILNEACK
jgi:predicted glycogen debranching enzyme